jgi:hypothetical protein
MGNTEVRAPTNLAEPFVSGKLFIKFLMPRTVTNIRAVNFYVTTVKALADLPWTSRGPYSIAARFLNHAGVTLRT